MRTTDRVRILLTTAADEAEATRIARALVERELAACVNVVPRIRSVYRWEGSVHDEAETLLIVKTVGSRLSAAARAIRELHAYDVPELIVLPVEAGGADYLDWVEAQTR